MGPTGRRTLPAPAHACTPSPWTGTSSPTARSGWSRTMSRSPEAAPVAEHPHAWFDAARFGLFVHFGLYSIATWSRSEEHTSELQSRGHLVCRLLLEKK